MATKDKIALTPTQVKAYPVPSRRLSIRGEKIAPSPAATSDAAFMELARERFKLCCDAEGPRREQMLTDWQFRFGDDSNQWQWDAQILRTRTKKKRPSHTVNRLPEFTKHVVNNMRQSRPAIKVNPVGDGADQEQADIRQGLIRHIEVKSQAPAAYDTAFEHMCIMGLGWIRVVDDWSDSKSFDKDLFIRWVPNPLSVYSDPNAALPDWSDMQYAFVVRDMLPAEFIERYPEAKAVSASNFTSIGDQKKYWMPGGNIRVAEYFYIDQKKDVLCELGPNKARLFSELPEGMYSVQAGRLVTTDTGEDIGPTRDCVIPIVKWALITGLDKLDERTWKGSNIPLVPVIGNQADIDGEKLINGMVRYARELQRLYNYVFSTLTEVVALTPKNQFIAEFDQLAEFREMFERANIDPQSVLVYRMKVDQNGTALPPPQRSSAVVEISGLVSALQVIDNMLKSIFGIYDASLGQRGPQESGLAINARKIESDTSTYDWGDNFIRSLEYLGRILNDLLAPYYNIPGRIIEILREDQSTDTIVFNQEFLDKKTKQPKKFDLSEGKFAVEISTGPSYQTKRKESADAMIQFFTKLDPQALQACAPMLVREMDFPGKDAIAAQLEKLLPPGLKDQDPDQVPDPAEQQQKIDQMQGLIQQLTQELHASSDKKELEIIKQEYETYREKMVQEVTLAVAELKTGTQQAQFLSTEIFNEFKTLRAMLEPRLAADAQGGGPQPAAPAGPPPGAPPVLAGPQTAGG